MTDAFGTIGGGRNNQAGDGAGTADDRAIATVGGGAGNTASGYGATVAGGGTNGASGNFATVAGGSNNGASGSYATVAGGTLNRAPGDSSFAAGSYAHADHAGAFVWADSRAANFVSTADDQFSARATGGVRFVSAIAGATGNPTAGVTLAAGGNSWGMLSDRSLKENFVPVDGRVILGQLSAIAITRWNLRAQGPAIRHLGPMAEDFHAAFGLGESARYINGSDADGIALAAIQALYRMTLALEARLTELDALRARLEALERAAPAGEAAGATAPDARLSLSPAPAPAPRGTDAGRRPATEP